MNRISAVRPEFALKQANDLINSAVGSNADREKRMALEKLHGVIGVKKQKGAWTKFYETLMKRHIELCVDLKDHITAKDGLHQYRNLCIQSEPASLETVVVYLLELSETKASQAKQKANKVAIAAAARIADLDQEESPESIMLSSMTEEGAIERTDREVVVPWLKFLWENYRAILELLYRLPKLEKLYHETCRRAFQFCLDYNRKLEFRRLCEMLRNQLENLQKPPTMQLKLNKQQWEWTTENIEFHMQTRFAQLDKATTMEQWNEAFRTVEDISKIMAKKAPKSKLMITYYERLTKIFWVADNKLFHAYSLLKLYQFSTPKSTTTPEEKMALATAVVLAALSVPALKDDSGGVHPAADEAAAAAAAQGDDGMNIDRNAQLAGLLDFHASNPTRQSLLQEIMMKGLLAEVYPEFQGLYEQMEMKFSPLTFVKSITSCLQAFKKYPAVKQYSVAMEKMIVVKVIQQLSKVYTTVKLDFVWKLLLGKKNADGSSNTGEGLQELSSVQIERVILEATRLKQLSLKINHVQNCIIFVPTTSTAAVPSSSTPGTSAASAGSSGPTAPAMTTMTTIDNQSYQLGTLLKKAAFCLEVSKQSPKDLEEKMSERKNYFNKVYASFDDEYGDLLERKRLIERRKEAIELRQQEKLEEERRQKESEEVRRLREEKERLEREEKQRLLEKRLKEIDENDITRMIIDLKKFGVHKERAEIAALTPKERIELMKSAEADYRKQRDEENRKKESVGKNVDFKIRAERTESAPAIERRQDRWMKEDKELEVEISEKFVVEWTKEHQVKLEMKKRLEKVTLHRPSYEARIVPQQQTLYDTFRKKEMLRRRKEMLDMNIAMARKRLDEENDRREEEERQRLYELEQNKIELERNERLKKQRELEEKAERDRETMERNRAMELERMKRELKEAENKKLAASASTMAAPASAAPGAAPAAAGGAGKYQPPTARNDPFAPRQPSTTGAAVGGAYRPPVGGSGSGAGGGGGGGGSYVPPSARREPSSAGGAGGGGGFGGNRGSGDRGGDRGGAAGGDRGGGGEWRGGSGGGGGDRGAGGGSSIRRNDSMGSGGREEGGGNGGNDDGINWRRPAGRGEDNNNSSAQSESKEGGGSRGAYQAKRSGDSWR